MRATSGAWLFGIVAGWCVACSGPELVPPRALTANGEDGQVTLQWTRPNAEGLRGFNLRWGTDGSNLSASVLIGPSIESWTVRPLANGTLYYFAIDAEDRAGRRSPSSPIVTARPALVERTAPSLIASIPDDGARDVSTHAQLSLRFSEPMNAPTVEVSMDPVLELGEPRWNSNRTELSFPSMAALASTTAYRVFTRGEDHFGNSLMVERAFTTAAAQDAVAPSLTSTLPAQDEAAVPVERAFTLVFSEPMDERTVSVRCTPNVTFAAPGWSADRTTVILTPEPALVHATAYEVAVEGDDLGRNPLRAQWSFTTANAPDAAPILTSHSPPDGAIEVPRNVTVSLAFSTPPEPEELERALLVQPATKADLVWNDRGTVVRWIPIELLAPATLYQVSIDDSLRFAFTTSTSVDLSAPRVVAHAPFDGAVGVDVRTGIALAFSESMDKASTEAAFDSSAPGTFLWNQSATQLLFRPHWPFGSGELVPWSISTAEDLAGNPLFELTEGSFRIVREGQLRIASDPMADGHLFHDGTTNASAQLALVGDDEVDGYSRAYLSFSIAELPADVRLRGAALYLFHAGTAGAPFEELGPLHVESVTYGSTLDDADRDLTPFATFVVPASTGWHSVDVLPAVLQDWMYRHLRGDRSQFRLRHQVPLSADRTHDRSYWMMGEDARYAPTLVVWYEYP